MSGGVPAGWVLVPVEPTEAMVEAGRWPADDDGPSACWSAMLSAVPTPTPPIEGRDADVERVARAMAPTAWEPFDPKQHGSPVNQKSAQEMWRDKARAALQALGERGVSDMAPERRKFIQDLFIRVCRDSGFAMSYDRAAYFAGKVGGFHPMDVWTAMPDLDTMRKIAAGEHPAAHKDPRP